MQLSSDQIRHLKRLAVHKGRNAEVFMLLDNHQAVNAAGLHNTELAFACGVKHALECPFDGAFNALKQFTDTHSHSHIFGFLTYDLKNDLEALSSGNPDRIGFPSMYFFVPEALIIIDKNGAVSEGKNLAEQWLNEPLPSDTVPVTKPDLRQKVSKEKYLENVRKIRDHIIAGDVYELNYCAEFFAEDAIIDPFGIYLQLSESSPVPFGGMLRLKDKYLLCASPERFLMLKDRMLYSQPIKGTARRGSNEAEDDELKKGLLGSEKERAENLMIVDLVRNDMARSAETGSVKVEELFGIYTFPHVHQMISTVSARKKEGIHPVDAIRNAFPMGSMTGAPKIMSMQLIEKYEETRRGLYSGSIGYFKPGGDFDFNVVIRSIQYNATSASLSFETGGAITYDSVPEEEYEECLLKAGFIIRLLTGKAAL